MTIEQSLAVIKELHQELKKQKLKTRAYVSTAFYCPFEGAIAPKQAMKVIDALMDLGVQELSIGDTIGMAAPKQVENLLKLAIRNWKANKLAVHFHDTRGTALANTLQALEMGVKTVDASLGGLGGCPFAPGAAGNLATEDLVYMLETQGVRTGIDLEKLCQTSLQFHQRIGRPLSSKMLQTYASLKKTKLQSS
jgi:hydroxymethylglutaryl-CoA lyase